METKPKDTECSFCGATISLESPGMAVAGPRVFICRECVEICIEVMADYDPEWREQKIAALIALRETPIRWETD